MSNGVRLRWAVNCTQWSPTRHEWLAALGCLQGEEVERVGSFVYQKDCKLALVGRLLIRAALTSLLQLRNNEIQLTRSEKGKPLLVRNGTIDNSMGFNISHQGDYVVLAAQKGNSGKQVTMDTRTCTQSPPAVGVDVMQLSVPRGASVNEFFSTMSRQFTSTEWEQIKQPNTQHLANFYRFWCLKESFIKAEGSGLSYGLQNLEFHTDPALPWPPPSHIDVYESTRLFVKGQLCEEWGFQESLIDSQHCVAVAATPTRGPPVSTTPPTSGPPFTKLSISSLLDCLEGMPATEELWARFIIKDNH
ncbi:L-aminoadipate-semialdehyde dehydrogenase-phosphopantetheinyl transferase-like isoform X2 [Halichondria panicea]|uniref:L-aminoadipate-semialdehyde dehydrogenase-phosphopantetheinyl transferase-like isoform X2 n=1 Tax=Halichondria panicea TaxID=6063 RepID=UPI00312B9AB1